MQNEFLMNKTIGTMVNRKKSNESRYKCDHKAIKKAQYWKKG